MQIKDWKEGTRDILWDVSLESLRPIILLWNLSRWVNAGALFGLMGVLPKDPNTYEMQEKSISALSRIYYGIFRRTKGRKREDFRWFGEEQV